MFIGLSASTRVLESFGRDRVLTNENRDGNGLIVFKLLKVPEWIWTFWDLRWTFLGTKKALTDIEYPYCTFVAVKEIIVK